MAGSLDSLFDPKNIAVIGASERANSVGQKVFYNLIRSEYSGQLFAVNPKHKSIYKRPCVASVADIKEPVDLAVITTPAPTILEIMKACGEKGIRGAIIISSGFSEMGADGKALEADILKVAKQYGIRFIGPNCLGVMRPQSHVNATFDNNNALAGQVALVSQSGAICAAILDWAVNRQIGFSSIVSMGNSADVDFGDVLQYLANDPATKSILLYIEGIRHPRLFIQGLHAAASQKPVIVLKAGRHSLGVRAAHSHTGALVGDDDVFNAALERGGAVRVKSIEQLFTAAEVLSSDYRSAGNKLMIVTNGGGAGVMAADRAADLNIELPTPDDGLLTSLNAVLPANWSHQNPVDILGDADPKRYQQAVSLCLQDASVDGLLAMLVPVSMSKPLEVAKEIATLAKQSNKPLITCWMGDKQTEKSRHFLNENHIPSYSTPEVAVEAFSYLANYTHNQQLLSQTNQIENQEQRYDLKESLSLIQTAILHQQGVLTMLQTKKILSAFHIPVSETRNASSLEELLSQPITYPVVMKINSPDITHKQDVGGVRLNIENEKVLVEAFNTMMQSVKSAAPKAKIEGVTIEPMYASANDREVMVGVLRDKVFGPVISVGLGGSLVEVVHDRAVALPPLNTFMIKHMIAKTLASKMLDEFRGKPPVKMELLIDILLRVSDMVRELPQIQAMDLNPIMIDDKRAVVVDARLMVEETATSEHEFGHMAIHPFAKYPSF